MNQMKKKIIAALLTLCLVVGLLPLSAMAASWKVTLNGTEVTLTENEETGAITSEPDQSNYYKFQKVDTDTFAYYTTDEVYVGTLTGTPVAGGAVADTEVKVDAPTVEAPTEGEKVDVPVDITVSDEDATMAVDNAAKAEGVVTVTIPDAIDSAGNVIPADQVASVAVTLPTNLVTKAVENTAVTVVEVKTTVATVALPTVALAGASETAAVKLTVSATTTVAAPASSKGSISLNLTIGSSAVTEFKEPVAVTIPTEEVTAEQAKSLVVAYAKGSIWERVNSFFDAAKKAFTFHTRHFSDFAVVDASASQPAAITAPATGTKYTLDVEANESLVALIEAKSGLGYISSNATADAPEASLRSASVDVPATDLANVWVVIGDVARTSVNGVDMINPENGQASIMAVKNAD